MNEKSSAFPRFLIFNFLQRRVLQTITHVSVELMNAVGQSETSRLVNAETAGVLKSDWILHLHKFSQRKQRNVEIKRLI